MIQLRVIPGTVRLQFGPDVNITSKYKISKITHPKIQIKRIR